MNFLDLVYHNRLAENGKNLRYWEDYLYRLQALDFNVFADQLKVPALVPVGSRIMFRGQITHTNEVTIALGQGYFAKCSIKQAEVLKQHRIKDAQSKVDEYRKEREYYESHLSFNKECVSDNGGQEIFEPYDEEEEKRWRITHRENMRQYKQNNKSKDNLLEREIDDEELWDKLDELELQEDMENELQNIKTKDNHISSKHINTIDYTSSVEEVTQLARQDKDKVPKKLKSKLPDNTPHKQTMLIETFEQKSEREEDAIIEQITQETEEDKVELLKFEIESKLLDDTKDKRSRLIETVKRESQRKKDAFRKKNAQETEQEKLDFLAKYKNLQTLTGFDIKTQVIEKLNKTNEIQIELHEAKETRTEEELLYKLNRMEQLDDLEDDINRINDLLEVEDSEDEAEYDSDMVSKLNSRVTFADEEDAETIEITFSHSDHEPKLTPYKPDEGILSPRDIYEAYPNLFTETKSILKKSKYETPGTPVDTAVPKLPGKCLQNEENENIDCATRTIVVSDVIENSAKGQTKVDTPRPTSLFKQRRQMRKF